MSSSKPNPRDPGPFRKHVINTVGDLVAGVHICSDIDWGLVRPAPLISSIGFELQTKFVLLLMYRARMRWSLDPATLRHFRNATATPSQIDGPFHFSYADAVLDAVDHRFRVFLEGQVDSSLRKQALTWEFGVGSSPSWIWDQSVFETPEFSQMTEQHSESLPTSPSEGSKGDFQIRQVDGVGVRDWDGARYRIRSDYATACVLKESQGVLGEFPRIPRPECPFDLHDSLVHSRPRRKEINARAIALFREGCSVNEVTRRIGLTASNARQIRSRARKAGELDS